MRESRSLTTEFLAHLRSGTERMTKEYTGSVYIGVVGSEYEHGQCRDSIERIVRRPGDSGLHLARGTKGYESRQWHFERWHETHHPFMLLLDADEVYPPDTLERLRSHKKPYVSVYYLRRQYSPIAPVWFKPGDRWPFMPWLTVPESGKLHELGASGWGGILLHREVADAVKEILRGEQFVIEDDMDVWPYDLNRVMYALNGLRELVEDKPPARTLRAALKDYQAILSDEIRPLRGKHNVVGSDIRFPFYARAAGYKLYGDPDLQVEHMTAYPLRPQDFADVPEERRKDWYKQQKKGVDRRRREIRKHLNSLGSEE